MRITDIIIKNYRAFYGEYDLSLGKDGKNLMVFGENGSGKSSLFTALKTFFNASIAKVEMEENIFIPASQKNSVSIRIRVRENKFATAMQEYEVDATNRQILGSSTLIADANKIKGFFDYRSLLKTHLDFVGKDSVDIFEILVGTILNHAENRFTNGEIGVEWKDIKSELMLRKGTARVTWLKENTESFSQGLKLLLAEIEEDTNSFIHYFDRSLSIKIEFDGCYYDEDDKWVYGDNAFLHLTYAGRNITKHHLFLNEARLSALAICLYLASIKVNPLTGALKVLVLDDLLIGLDMGNRLPLLHILQDNFINVDSSERFQIIMTTYDRVWFELVNNFFGAEGWKFLEIYSMKLKDEDFEFPILKDSFDYLERAKSYLLQNDNKACAVYVRTEFEKIIKKICVSKALLVEFKSRQKEFDTNDFWQAIADQTNIDKNLVKEIEMHRSTVMNPFSHYDLEKPEFAQELRNTISAIEKLRKIDVKSLSKITFADLNNRLIHSNTTIEKKQLIIDRLRKLIAAKC